MMKNTHFNKQFALLAIMLTISAGASAQFRLPALISDGMVLQRDTPLNLWGWATPGETVKVEFNNRLFSTTCTGDSTWCVKLPATAAGGPFALKINTSDTSVLLQDVLLGDVWVCSGQSNMELTMERASPLYPDEIRNATFPDIRYFQVPKTYFFQSPKADAPGGKWVSVNPQTIQAMSAISYFFGKELNATYNIPIGLINTALGGSPIQAWMSAESLKSFPEYYREAQQFKSDSLIAAIENQDRQLSRKWYERMNREDRGLTNPGQTWYAASYNSSDWPVMEVPGYWAAEEPVNGVMWFRRTFDAPASMLTTPIHLELGTIVDADSVFVNDTFIGTTSYQYPPRRYQIPAGVLRKENNVIAIRVINERGRGGFTTGKPYHITNGTDTISLTGRWHYQLGVKLPPLSPPTFIRWKSGGLYNAMLAPLTHHSIKGIIWYQGESNTGAPEEYEALLKTMITDWRTRWHQPDLPFIVAQLPNFMRAHDQPTSSNWARIRESQASVLDLPHTGLAVNIDLGEWNDIHPLNKKDVAHRLALAARNAAYHEHDLIYSGPLFESMKIKGSKVILSFRHTDGGLKAENNRPGGFVLAGPDQQFYWAEAQVKGQKIILQSLEVTDPVAVRYAWADNPDRANIYNAAGLPLAPFRTDHWAK